MQRRAATKTPKQNKHHGDDVGGSGSASILASLASRGEDDGVAKDSPDVKNTKVKETASIPAKSNFAKESRAVVNERRGKSVSRAATSPPKKQ